MVDTYLEPTADQVDAAWLEVDVAELALQDAGDYLKALEAGPDAEIETVVTNANSDLGKLSKARLDLEAAQSALDDTLLTAPISGTVTSLNANVGQTVSTASILTIETLDQMSLRVLC